MASRFQHRLPMNRRGFLRLLTASAVGGLTLPVLHGCATDPVTGRRRVMLMSESEEIAIDRQHAPHQFSNDYGLLRDAGVNRYMDSVGSGIARVSHRPDMPYAFNVVNANHVNAYTFPGGTMACTRGILVEMEDEAELAALLGHETGHVTARHTARRQTSQLLTAVALGGAGIALSQSDRLAGHEGLVFAIGSIGATALLAHYSRDNEREADALGLDYMVDADHNPEGMVALMDMLRGLSSRQPNALEAMFSTHPMSEERYRTAERAVRREHDGALERDRGHERYMDNIAPVRALKPAIEEMRAGEAELARENPARAEGHFARALEQAPDDYPGLLLMARAQSAQGRHREAEGYLAQARATYPEEGQALHHSGINQLAQEDPERALTFFQAYEAQLPGNPNTTFLQGVAHEGMGDRVAAADHYRRYLNAAGDTEQARYAAERLNRWQAEG